MGSDIGIGVSGAERASIPLKVLTCLPDTIGKDGNEGPRSGVRSECQVQVDFRLEAHDSTDHLGQNTGQCTRSS